MFIWVSRYLFGLLIVLSMLILKAMPLASDE